MTGPSTGSAAAPPLGRYAAHAPVTQKDPPAVVALKHQLLLTAVEKSPRLRSDLDLLVITQHFATLESLAHVSPHALHYLATECASMTLRDGDVFCYQEDAVVADSNALVILDGSLCGYFNKPFSQRTDATEPFTSWNARQNRRRGVLVDFGDFQTTYAVGALCGIDDLLVTVPPVASDTSDLRWLRRKGIELTRAIVFKKDTLDRAAQRFGLAVERGVLHSQRENALTDVSHLAPFSGLSESSKQALLQHAPRRHVPRGDALFSSPRDATSVTITAVAIVLAGRLDVYWTAAHDDLERETSHNNSTTAATACSPTPDQPSPGCTARGTPNATSSPLFSVRRGQTIGDQALGLALDQRYGDGDSSPLHRLPLRLVSGDDTTEVLLIPIALYHEKRAEDQALHEYAAQLHHQRQHARQPGTGTGTGTGSSDTAATLPPLFEAWAPSFFAAKTPVERSRAELHALAWRLRVDSAVGKACFQLPPLVLERLCHAMELVHFDAPMPSLVLHNGAESDELFIVAHGALRCTGASGSDTVATLDETWYPGDLFGLLPRVRGTTVFADPGTMLLAVPRPCIERWLQPVKTELVANAGSLFHRHAAYIAAHPPPRATLHEKRKSLTAMTRRASAQSGATADENTASMATAPGATAHTDALAALLTRMGVLASVPRFVLRELLLQSRIVEKHAGEVVCHENEPSTSLVVVLSGFVRVFSLEHMGVAVDMFRGHPFCHFASLHHLLTKQAGDLGHEGGSDGSNDLDGDRLRATGSDTAAPAVLTRHRSAMYGLHLQTLHAPNAFRTGVLRDRTLSPATVVAQTPTTLLLIDEAAFAQILKAHAPGIDLASYHLQAAAAPVVSPSESALSMPPGTDDDPRQPQPEPLPPSSTETLTGGQHVYPAQLAPPLLLRFVEQTAAASPLAWLTQLTPTKRQLVLRSARVLSLPAGGRVLCHGDLVSHVFIVVSGALALYVRQQHDRVATALDASQRSVRSLLLERNVTSNYSTTSHQLSSLDALSLGGADPRRLQHKRAMLQQKVSRMVTAGATATSSVLVDGGGSVVAHARATVASALPQPATSSTSVAATARPSNLFVQSVVAAVREDKRKSVSSAVVASPVADATRLTTSPPRKASVTALTFHAAVSRATLAHRLDQQRHDQRGDAVPTRVTRLPEKARGNAVTARATEDDHAVDGSRGGTGHHGTTLLCHLRVGDVLGEEALSSLAHRSPHDVFAEVTPSSSSSSTGASVSLSLPLALPSATVELLCIERAAFLAVQRKSDDEAEQELRGRAKAAKSKWQLAEQIVTTQKRASLATTESAKKTPKLLDLFKNILNQRYYLTMRAIAEIPLLHELTDAVKREICVGARFEAVERFTNVYKDDAATGGSATSRGNHGTSAGERLASPPLSVGSHLRYYFVLSGRVGLFPRSAVHGAGGSVGVAPYASGSAMGGTGSSGNGSGTSSSGKHGSVSMSPAALSSLAAAASHFAGLSASMDTCLRDVSAGGGFGEFEVLVPEASRHHMLAVALEPTKLLSLPGDLFVRHWPRVREIERHIAYLRGTNDTSGTSGTSDTGGENVFFARLEMEKVASLYYALRDESYDRGARILEQQAPLTKSEVVFLKTGECSLTSTITVQSRAPTDDGTTDRHDHNHDHEHTHNQELRVRATIADVRAGHVFWLDARSGAPPFSLHATSSRVYVARIAVDKLRAILPKSQLAQLERSSDVLAARFRDQLARARETIVRLMNEKRYAELHGRSGESGVATFLPSLHYTMQRANKKRQLQSLVGSCPRPVASSALRNSGGSGGSDTTASRSKKQPPGDVRRDGPLVALPSSLPPAIPYARVLASKPIDLARVLAEDRADRRHHQTNNNTDDDDDNTNGDGDQDGTGDSSPAVFYRGESALDVAYRAGHEREHYSLGSEPTGVGSLMTPSATPPLCGSFPDDPSLRRRRHHHHHHHGMTTRSTSDSDTARQPVTTLSPSSKVDETAAPETTTTAPARVQLQVTLPTATPIRRSGSGSGSASGRRARSSSPAPPLSTSKTNQSSSPSPRSSSPSSSSPSRGHTFVVDFYGDPTEWAQLNHATGVTDNADVTVDLRTMLHAELQSPLSPLRAIKLESSGSKHHSQGKYVRLEDSPSESSSLVCHVPLGLPSSGWTPRAPPKRNEQRASTPTRLPPSQLHSEAVMRKRGFLFVLDVPHDATAPGFVQDQFLRTVIHRQRRRFVVLEDSVLREYAEDTSIVDGTTTVTTPTSRVNALRTIQLTNATVVDAPDTLPAGENAAVLRQSFVLQASRRLVLLTCASPIDKVSWMRAISAAVCMGTPVPLVAPVCHTENGAPGSPKFKHRESVAVSLAHRETRRSSMTTSGGGGRNAVVQQETVLEVEYRIS